MADETYTIKCSNIDYAIYKVGNWKNEYKLNLVGTSDEIPVTNVTKKHVLFNMEEIRKSEFDMGGRKVNGIVALGSQLNPEVSSMSVDDLVALESKEYDNIIKEINHLELLDDDVEIDLATDQYLIYKLVKEQHSITASKPANQFTVNHHMEEIKKLQKQANQE